MGTLKLGSSGEEVKALLKALGITPDGDFGPKTEEAVKLFLEEHNLVPDGIVGLKTRLYLFKIDIIKMPLKVHITKKDNRLIKYLAIHYTAGGNSKKGAARACYNIFNTRKASADFAVDDEEIVQFNPDIKNYYCWAVGDNGGKNNSTTVSIEICSNLKKGTSAGVPNHEGWYFTKEALENAKKLASYLILTYNIPNVVRHYDLTGKACPGISGWNDKNYFDSKTGKLLATKNNSTEWLKFKNSLL